jgi:hypothetical protein
MPVKAYVLSARRIKVLIRKPGVFVEWRESVRECVPARTNVSTLIARRALQICDSVKQCQTRLKLKARVSTLYIQVEECLSVSCFHHSAEGGMGERVKSYL